MFEKRNDRSRSYKENLLDVYTSSIRGDETFSSPLLNIYPTYLIIINMRVVSSEQSIKRVNLIKIYIYLCVCVRFTTQVQSGGLWSVVVIRIHKTTTVFEPFVTINLYFSLLLRRMLFLVHCVTIHKYVFFILYIIFICTELCSDTPHNVKRKPPLHTRRACKKQSYGFIKTCKNGTDVIQRILLLTTHLPPPFRATSFLYFRTNLARSSTIRRIEPRVASNDTYYVVTV